MDLSTLGLFIAFLLFSALNLALNTKIHTDRVLKVFTYYLGVASLIIAGCLLLASFIKWLYEVPILF